MKEEGAQLVEDLEAIQQAEARQIELACKAAVAEQAAAKSDQNDSNQSDINQSYCNQSIIGNFGNISELMPHNMTTEEVSAAVEHAQTKHENTQKQLRKSEAGEQDQVRRIERLELQSERQQNNFELKNTTEIGEFQKAQEEIARELEKHSSEVETKRAKVESLHGSDANEQRTQKMESARAAAIQAARDSSERCGLEQEAEQEAIEVDNQHHI